MKDGAKEYTAGELFSDFNDMEDKWISHPSTIHSSTSFLISESQGVCSSLSTALISALVRRRALFSIILSDNKKDAFMSQE